MESYANFVKELEEIKTMIRQGLNTRIFDRYYIDVMVYDEIEKFGDYHVGDEWKFTYPYQNRTTLVDSHSLEVSLDNHDD